MLIPHLPDPLARAVSIAKLSTERIFISNSSSGRSIQGSFAVVGRVFQPVIVGLDQHTPVQPFDIGGEDGVHR